MEISFSDAQLRTVFNSYRLLKSQFGADVAQTISTRMSVLRAAPRLAAVPSKPPIALTAEGGRFSVSLARAKRLQFQAATRERVAVADPALISEIEILGVVG